MDTSLRSEAMPVEDFDDDDCNGDYGWPDDDDHDADSINGTFI